MYIQNNLSLAKRNKGDKKHRLYEAIHTIKDCFSKKMFNQACEHAAKYYQQNKNSLNNQQIYQLCWLSCQSISKKISIRLSSKSKSNTTSVTQFHFSHLFSLYLSIHALIFPEVVNRNKPYFNMLATSQQMLKPHLFNPNQLIFKRKKQAFFLQKNKVDHEIKRIIKQHLKITNSTIMFKTKQRSNIEQVIQTISIGQKIFDSFKEYEFPRQKMDFELIKLTIIQELRLKDKIKCEYNFPVGFINKLYILIKSGKEQAINYYIKKLNCFICLSFRNLEISFEDMYIIVHEILHMSKIIKDIHNKQQSKQLRTKKIIAGQKIKRQITIDTQSIQQNGSKHDRKIGSERTQTKISQKKIFKPQVKLKSIVKVAFQKMTNYIKSRKELNLIILSYFEEGYIKHISNTASDEIIENQVVLEINSKLKKNPEYDTQDILQAKGRRKFKSLSAIFHKKLDKKMTIYEDGEQKQIFTKLQNKKQGKFVIKNIQNINTENVEKGISNKLINRIINNINLGEIEITNESSSDEEGQMKHDFEKLRRQKLKEINHNFNHKQKSLSKSIVEQQPMNDKQMALLMNKANEQQVDQISMLDDVVSLTINQLLQLPYNQSSKSKLPDPLLEKLKNLKIDAQYLNTQRMLLVERLVMKHKVSIDTNKWQVNNLEQKLQLSQKNQEQISKIPQNMSKKLDIHIAKNIDLMKIRRHKQPSINKYKAQVSKPNLKLNDKINKKIPELTYNRLQQEYQKISGLIEQKKQAWDMVLSCQYDKLRRDVSKNQFASQNQKKNNKKEVCKTIVEMTLDYE